MRTRLISSVSTLAFSVAFLAASSAAAQTSGFAAAAPASQAGSGMEEVVVTARRRSENIEKVPVSITAFNANQIAERQIRTETDLQTAVPGLLIRETHGSSSLNFALRGQSIDAFTGSSPAVLVYVNDVQANSVGTTSLFDLSSIQVLKGPQGTLFGRNTTGGAVLYETTKPGDTFSGYVTERLGNYALVETIAAVDLPITDGVLVRLAGDTESHDGFIHNVFNDSYLGALSRTTGRATVVLKPFDGLENTTVFEYESQKGSNVGNEIYSVYPCGATNHGIPLNSTGACLFGPTLDKTIGVPGAWAAYLAAHPGANPGGLVGALAKQQRLGAFAVDSSSPSLTQSYNWYFDNTTTYDFSDKIKLKNIVGVSQSNLFDESDAIGVPFGLYNPYNPVTGTYGSRIPGKTTQVSEEAQLLGKALDDKLDYIFGVYYSHSRQSNRDDNSFFDLSPVVPVTPTIQAFQTTSQSEAVFTQGSYDLSAMTGVEGLKFTAGFRYTWEQEDLSQLGVEFGRFTGAPPESDTFSNPSWQVGLDYQITPDLLAYVVQRGSWRSGGFNGFATPIKGVANVGGNEFLPETTYDVEVGAKYRGNALGIPGLLNVALYNQWIDNVQRSEYFLLNGATIAATTNIPAAEVSGFEVEGNIYPTDWLEIGGGGAYTYARYTDGVAITFGTRSVYGPYGDAPRWAGSIHVQLTLPTPEPWGDMSVRAELYGQTSVFFSNLNNTTNPGTQLPGYGLLNLRYDWRNMFDTDVTLSAFAKNVLDKQYYQGGIGVGVDFGVNSAIPGDPQMFGVELTYKFGGEKSAEAAPAAYTPPPVQVPAPAAPKSYLVFFDFNKSDLSSQAVQIVDRAAANALQAKVTRIDVTGHTDTVGSDAYNMRLSRRRAESVAAELETRGVPASEIGIIAKGKRDLLVPTGDGVREPQNRRVQIVYADAQAS